MRIYRPGIPPHVAEVIRHLPPDVYSIDRRRRVLRILAVGHRRRIYEEAVRIARRQAKPP